MYITTCEYLRLMETDNKVDNEIKLSHVELNEIPIVAKMTKGQRDYRRYKEYYKNYSKVQYEEIKKMPEDRYICECGKKCKTNSNMYTHLRSKRIHGANDVVKYSDTVRKREFEYRKPPTPVLTTIIV